MKKIIVKMELHDNKDKQKAMKAVSTLQGIDSIAIDMKETKMTVIGTVDPINVVSKLRKTWRTNIVSVGPAKEPEKKDEGKKEEAKKEEAKKDEGKKEEAKKDEGKKEEGEKKKDPNEQIISELVNAYKAYNPHMTTQYFVRSIEENPNSCAIL